MLRTSGPLPPLLAFGESKVTSNMVREYEKAGFFSPGAGHAPLDELIPTPKEGEIEVFRDFFVRVEPIWLFVSLVLPIMMGKLILDPE
jgi:hypothetical protein